MPVVSSLQNSKRQREVEMNWVQTVKDMLAWGIVLVWLIVCLSVLVAVIEDMLRDWLRRRHIRMEQERRLSGRGW